MPQHASVMFRAALLLGAIGSLAEAGRFRLPSDVGGDKGADHPCVGVMRETKAACEGTGNSYGSSSEECNFALCYTADLNRGRCESVVTTGAPKNVKFSEELDQMIEFHAVTCDDGAQGGKGIRNAKFDCGKVKGAFVQKFATSYPISWHAAGCS
mmetsp:Transcript_31813/g.62561  ORF Transcript_31813/g.62561 Transcript_31813/m.62561 type:complete len:155 (-) Transcript_31813:74-538(-)